MTSSVLGIGKKTVLVTAATGNVGHSTIKMLCSCDKCRSMFNIRAGCYVESERSYTIETTPDCEIYKYDASFSDERLNNAFRGVDYAFLVPSRSAQRVTHMRNYVDACKQAGVRFILMFSMIRAQQTASRWGSDYAAMEQIVEESGIEYCILRCALQQQTLFLLAPDLIRGALPLPIATGGVAMISTIDVAKAARAVLQNVSQHAYKAYHLTGPEVMTGVQMARIASDALKRGINFINVTPMGARKLLADSGLEPWLAEEFLEMFAEVASHLYEYQTAELVQWLTNAKPMTMYDFFLDHKERFSVESGVLPTEAPPEGAPDVPVGAAAAAMTTTQPTAAPVAQPQVRRTQVVLTPTEVTQPQPPIATTEGAGKGVGGDRPLIERTRDHLQRWIFQAQALIDHLGEMQNLESQRLRQLDQFKSEVEQQLGGSHSSGLSGTSSSSTPQASGGSRSDVGTTAGIGTSGGSTMAGGSTTLSGSTSTQAGSMLGAGSTSTQMLAGR